MSKRETFKAAADGFRPVSLLEEITDDAPTRPAAEAESPQESQEPANITGNMVTQRDSVSDGLRAIQATRKPAARVTTRAEGRTAIPKAVRDHAESLAKTTAKNVSYKIPGGIDEWLAIYQFRHRAEKVLKQDLIALALTRFIEQVEAEEGILAD